MQGFIFFNYFLKKLNFFQTLGAIPIAHIDQMTPEKLGSAKLIEEVTLADDSKVLKVTGVPSTSKTITLFIRGSNQLVFINIQIKFDLLIYFF